VIPPLLKLPVVLADEGQSIRMNFKRYVERIILDSSRIVLLWWNLGGSQWGKEPCAALAIRCLASLRCAFSLWVRFDIS